MTLRGDAKFEEKLTCGLENDMKNTENFLEDLKIAILMGSFNPKQKSMSLKSTEELCVMVMKNDPKFEEELTCHFKIDIRNLMNFDPST